MPALNFYQQMLVMYPFLKDDAELNNTSIGEEEAVRMYDTLFSISEIAHYMDSHNMTCSEFLDAIKRYAV